MTNKRRAERSQILLGYEAGTGEPVYIPLHHLVVTGTTQLSGKTTTLEGLISRSELTSIAFRTKRGEGSFRLPNVHTHEPFFRERADWQYVAGLLEATMREKMRFERSWIIDASKGARTLRGVLDNVVEQLDSAKGLSKSVLTTLKAYLEIVVPEIEGIQFAGELNLKSGLNVMDLVGLRDEVQSLVIASTLEALHESASGVIVVIPEAWKFVPEGRATPVKYPLEAIARQGAGVGVYVFLDSQDITGVDKAILKNVDTWLIGRQREKNEVERAIAQLPLPKGKRPKSEEIMRLPLGHFLVATRDEVRMVYVQPTWLDARVARAVARTGAVDSVAVNTQKPKQQNDAVMEVSMDVSKELSALRGELRKKDDEIRRLTALLEKKSAAPQEQERRRSRAPYAKELSDDAPDSGEREIVRHDVDVNVAAATLRVRERVVHVELTNDDNKGRAAILFAEGFFDEPRTPTNTINEFLSRGWGSWSGGGGRGRMGRLLLDMTEMGFLRRDGATYVARQDAKDRVEHVKERERK